jgi:diguanylate cyclase (GGDEF)-like protein
MADRTATPGAEGLGRGLSERLYDLLCDDSLSGDRAAGALSELARQHGDRVYAELLFLLCHLRFEPDQARDHWNAIDEHRRSMADRLGTEVDLRVALASYFVQVNRQLRNPKIIELQLFAETERSASRDSLTGLCNYRLFREHLDRELQKGRRVDSTLSLVMIDIDSFKNYNDLNGHEAGNQVLISIASLLRSSIRDVDIAARYGGEEFALVLPSTSKIGACRVAERALGEIESHGFRHRETQPGGKVTVSMGIATFPADASKTQELIEHADQALYVAKSRGKNQVYLYGQDRRSYRRVEASLDGRFCVLAAEYHSLSTVNLSERGLLFRAERELPLGSLIDLRLALPDAKTGIAASGRVVRVEEDRDGSYVAAIRIVEIAPRDRRRLLKFMRELESQPMDEPVEAPAS